MLSQQHYKPGFTTKVTSHRLPYGLNKNTIKQISAKKNEPFWMLERRLYALEVWDKMVEPNWSTNNYPKINYQDICYYSSPIKKKLSSLDEVDPAILDTYNKLGIPLYEQKMLSGVAIDAVFDSVSIATTHEETLKKDGIIFCSISKAIRLYPDLIQKYLGSVVPTHDNFFAALNAAVFSDGTFVYIPKNTKCPMDLSTYFRMNDTKTGQFERTLIIVEDGGEVSYLEGCTAPVKKDNQLHAAVVELVALNDSKIKYSTVQNWYPGDEKGQGGIYNFVTKRGVCKGQNSKISWIQLETGSAITWKYPSCILQGENSIGEFYSVAFTNNKQQADTGTKMIHIGKNSSSKIISKGISSGNSTNTYRGIVSVLNNAKKVKNYTQCDSLLLGEKCKAVTIPYIEGRNNSSIIEHEATASKISAEQLLYCLQRGISMEDATSLIVTGFCQEIIQKLPMEFAIEAKSLLNINIEGAVG